MTETLTLAHENRIMIDDIKNDIKEIKNKLEMVFNHMSNRLPMWATILFTILGCLVTGLIVNTL